MDWRRWRNVCERTSEFRPLRVEIEVAAPVCSPVPYLNLDALLADAARKLGRHWSATPVPNLPVDPDRIEMIPIPVALDPELNVWRCSCLWPAEDLPPFETAWVMRPATEYWFLAAPRMLRTQSGHTRMRRERLTVWPSRLWEGELEGHPHWVGRLLELVPAIGKKRSQGWGVVHQVRVFELDRPARWREWDGCAARPIPHPDGVPLGVRPPYWYRPWWEPGLEPGVEM